MKNKHFALLALTFLSTLHAQGTAFTYQGRLISGTNVANGSYDLTFGIWNAASGPGQLGDTITNSATAVSNGLFTVTLDFGSVFTGADRWLEIGARTNGGGAFTTLSPRQPITATPHAIVAANVASGGISSGTYPNAVTFNNGANSFSGNGGGLTNVNATSLGGLSSANFWKTNGNAGANPTNGAFLGTTDNLPLEFKVNGQRALRIEYATNGAYGYTPNMVGGFSGNIVSNGFIGAVIAGGGSSGKINRVGADFATVVGGRDNTASGSFSTAMGVNTVASGTHSTAMGEATDASGFDATAMGVGTTASGNSSTAMGDGTTASAGGGASTAMGYHTTASGGASTAMGESTTASGYASTAMGRRAKANHDGAFVWADSTFADFASTTNDQFLIRASGGVGIGTASPSSELDVNGAVTVASGSASAPSLTFSGDSNTGILHPSANTVAIATGGAERMRITSSGDVGIGTTDPVGALQVSGGTVIHRTLTPTSTSSSNLLNLMVGGSASPVATNGSLNGISFYEVAGAANMSFGYDGSGTAGFNALRIYDGAAAAICTFQQNGNVGIGTNNPSQKLHVIGNILASGTVTGSSDRNAKENFEPINSRDVLDKVAAMPISRWNYKTESDITHLGPMAQDFYSAFSVGMNDKTISMVDADGVALAAIQGLNQKVERENASLRAENAELKARLEKLERRFDKKQTARDE